LHVSSSSSHINVSSSSSVTDNPTLALFVLSDTYGKKCKKTKRKKQCKKKGKK
jgi:hypothetical protein